MAFSLRLLDRWVWNLLIFFGVLSADILHSYLALAALAVMKHQELKSIDSMLCVSVSAREHFEQETKLGRGEALESERSAEM